MPTIASPRSHSSPKLFADLAVDSTPRKRTLLSNSGSPPSSLAADLKVSPINRKSPRQSITDRPSTPLKRNFENSADRVMIPKSPPKKRLLDSFIENPILNPRGKLSEVKEALHVSTSQTNVVCRENEQNKALEFCKRCVEQEKAGSLYICGCPGTGRSLSMEKVKEALVHWGNEMTCIAMWL